MWFDSHCHLFDCEGDPEEVLTRARKAGVEDLLVAGTNVDTSRRAVELARLPGVHAAVGLHPSDATSWSEEVVSEIATLASEPGVVAIGETGLDFYWERDSEDVQRRSFESQIELAENNEKALVVHTRDSVDAALDMLEGSSARIVFHCWSGDAAQLGRAQVLGAYISFAGNVTFKNDRGLRERAREVAPDRLLVETDSPYLAPVPFRGRPNEPAHVTHVGQAVAAARGQSLEEIASLTSRNARTLFGLHA